MSLIFKQVIVTNCLVLTRQYICILINYWCNVTSGRGPKFCYSYISFVLGTLAPDSKRLYLNYTHAWDDRVFNVIKNILNLMEIELGRKLILGLGRNISLYIIQQIFLFVHQSWGQGFYIKFISPILNFYYFGGGASGPPPPDKNYLIFFDQTPSTHTK